jgi:hypothetical protein
MNEHIIVATCNGEIINNLFKIIEKGIKVKKAIKNDEIKNLRIIDSPYLTGYYMIKCSCTEEIYQWLNGFCTGYFVGINFENE